MKIVKSLPIFVFLIIAHLHTYTINAADFQIQNNCSFTIWAASIPIGGGRQLEPGQIWNITVPARTQQGRIWGRTGCNFNNTGRGKCQTGDCNGLLECESFGSPPNTLAEYALNQFNNLDFLDVSLVDGFNVPLNFSAASNKCNTSIACPAPDGCITCPVFEKCTKAEYSEDNQFIGSNFYISMVQNSNVEMGFVTTNDGCKNSSGCTNNIFGECPIELRVDGGCNNPCTVFKTSEYCCNNADDCGPTNYSRFFKSACPDAYSYPKDDATSTFTCPGGSDYRVVFCP